MCEKINLLKSLPQSSRPLDERKLANDYDRKHHWKLGKKYFDGTRRQGYGGYINDGRWLKVAKDIIEYFKLKNKSKILEIGSAKGFLLNSFHNWNKSFELWGADISLYAISKAENTKNSNHVVCNAKELPFDDDYFDLTISINSLHNILSVNDTIQALQEISRVTKIKSNSFISLGAYKNKKEQDTLDKWAVVASTYCHEQDWLNIFEKANYQGKYYWFKP